MTEGIQRLGISVTEGEDPVDVAVDTTPKINIEAGLITAVLDTGDMKQAVSKKIFGNFFNGPDKPIWEFMLQHYREFKKVPELAVIKRKYPDYNPISTNEPVDYFITELQQRQRYNMILKGMKEISAGLNAKSSDSAFNELVKLVSKINTEVQIHKDSNYNEEVDERIARMELKMKSMGVDGVSYGVDAMDLATGGMHPEELITVVGKPGTGKTYFELALMAKAFMLEGEDVLFISREMSGWQIEQRMDSILFEIPADKMKLGRFTTDEFEEYKKQLRELKGRDIGRMIVSADDEKGFGLTAVQAKIEEHLPNGGLVIIDGSYLLDDDEGNGRRSDWEKIVSITRGLKRMARRTGCTIAQSSQLGRGQKRGKSVDLDNISFSSSFEQDSDIVWALYQTEEMKAVGKMGVEGAKVREGDNPRLLLNWNFDTMKDFGILAEDITDAPDDDEDMVVY
jgi:replicative DNA helicase